MLRLDCAGPTLALIVGPSLHTAWTTESSIALALKRAFSHQAVSRLSPRALAAPRLPCDFRFNVSRFREQPNGFLGSVCNKHVMFMDLHHSTIEGLARDGMRLGAPICSIHVARHVYTPQSTFEFLMALDRGPVGIQLIVLQYSMPSSAAGYNTE
ncbi:hypothetical protein B0H19DRAFT_1079554 [Mycena capillaripes]|nr:hypothetical protein B0H19DRAFT_1079554 [Mycena capillaripes]